MKRTQLFLSKNMFKTNNKMDFLQKFVLNNNIMLKNYSGVYSMLNFGTLLLDNICDHIVDKLRNLSYNKMQLSSLNHCKTFGERDASGMFFIKDEQLLLSPTNEEVVFNEFKKNCYSKPVKLFQITSKFRNDRPKNLFRMREFLMMDLYGIFNAEQERDEDMVKLIEVNRQIMKFFSMEAESFNNIKEKFFNNTWNYESNVLINEESIEISHMFKFLIDDKKKKLFAHSYGIGVHRLMLAYLYKCLFIKDDIVHVLLRKISFVKVVIIVNYKGEFGKQNHVIAQTVYNISVKIYGYKNVILDDKMQTLKQQKKFWFEMGINKFFIIDKKNIFLCERFLRTNNDHASDVQKEKKIFVYDIDKCL